MANQSRVFCIPKMPGFSNSDDMRMPLRECVKKLIDLSSDSDSDSEATETDNERYAMEYSPGEEGDTELEEEYESEAETVAMDDYDNDDTELDEDEETVAMDNSDSDYDSSNSNSNKRPRGTYNNSNKRPLGTRKNKYNTRSISPSNEKSKNPIMWQLAAAGLGQSHTLDPEQAALFALELQQNNQSREAKIIAQKRPLAQESIREFLVENGLRVEDKPFFYGPAMLLTMDEFSTLHSEFGDKKYSTLITNFEKCITKTHGGCLDGLRTMMTKRLPGKAPTRFFFFV